MVKHVGVAVLALGLWLATPAFAAIGAVGSPVVPSNAPKKPVEEEKPAPEMQGEGAPIDVAFVPEKPLIVIRFSQNYVYYERALRNAIRSAEATAPDIFYEVVSYVPAAKGRAQAIRMQEKSRKNLTQVVRSMQALKVPMSRMSWRSQMVDGGEAQEVHVYVRESDTRAISPGAP